MQGFFLTLLKKLQNWYSGASLVLNWKDHHIIIVVVTLLVIITRSYATLGAADLDWIAGPGYSSNRYILDKNNEKPTLNHEKPWKPTWNH